MKYGLREAKFYNAIYENITERNSDYLNKFMLPKVKEIMDNFYEIGYIEGLKTIKKIIPTFMI